MHRGGVRSHGRGGRWRGSGGDGRGRRGGGYHPSGLSGRDIGLWYSRRGKANREKRDIDNRAVVSLNRQLEEDIASILQEKKTLKMEVDGSACCSSGIKQEPVVVNKIMEQKKPEKLPFAGIKCEDNSDDSNFVKSAFSYSGRHCCKLRSDEEIDNQLYLEMEENEDSKDYQRMLEFRKNLPSYKMKENILQLIRDNQVLVISGETGCGKTTQVAQFILDDCIKRKRGSTCHIICTQPRRISAISVADRVSAERGEVCGNSCGYQIRLESKLPRKQGSILYCTTGILLRRLINDPYMLHVSHIILDEIHERDLMSDFLLIIVRDLLPYRADLKVILMSATLNAEMFSSYFYKCPMLHIPGFTFPVKEHYLEDIIETLRYRVEPTSYKGKILRGKKKWGKMAEDEQYFDYLDSIKHRYSSNTISSLANMNFEAVVDYNLILALVTYICTTLEDGAILIFLPGWDQISRLHDLLQKNPVYNSSNFIMIPLHSMMPTTNQKEVFDRPPPGVRKIIIATNIAETSITIEDVVFVIDCGKSKEKTYDVDSNISCLQPVWVSKASARQRKGRAGRVQPGHCFHLFLHYHHDQFEGYRVPEMLRTPLDQLCLQLKILRLGKMWAFLQKAMQPPSQTVVMNAITSLTQMRALDENEELTALGYHLAKIPVAPKVGRMILFGAMFSCLDPVLTVAASLDFKEPFYIPIHKEKEADSKKLELSDKSKSDHIMLINAFKGWEESKKNSYETQYCWKYFLSRNTLKMIESMKSQFAQLLFDIGFLQSSNHKDLSANINSENINLVKAIICAGLYPNVSKVIHGNEKSKRPVRFTAEPHGWVSIHPKSVNKDVVHYESQWLIYHEKMKTTKLFLYDCTTISPFPLLFFGGVISVHEENGMDTIQVDEYIKFHSPLRIAQLVKELRHELDVLLNKKISNPSMELVAGRMSESRDEKILKAIIDLITTEKVKTKSESGYK